MNLHRLMELQRRFGVAISYWNGLQHDHLAQTLAPQSWNLGRKVIYDYQTGHSLPPRRRHTSQVHHYLHRCHLGCPSWGRAKRSLTRRFCGRVIRQIDTLCQPTQWTAPRHPLGWTCFYYQRKAHFLLVRRVAGRVLGPVEHQVPIDTISCSWTMFSSAVWFCRAWFNFDFLVRSYMSRTCQEVVTFDNRDHPLHHIRRPHRRCAPR